MATNPTLLIVPIAENGTKNTIPENQATPGNGLMSQNTGFPAECSLPLGAGGVAPDRADFNGAFNLLGGVAFYAQKGFSFNYDATQDYYAGCVVIDPTDGLRYECIADMPAGTIAPHDDTSNTYWHQYQLGTFNDNYTVIYPNGGSEGSPATAAANSRYVETNPFPGYVVACIAEVQYNGEWGVTEWYHDSNSSQSFGCKANQLSNDNIIVQTGSHGIAYWSKYTGNPFGISTGFTSAPCRVKVWKIGKVSA